MPVCWLSELPAPVEALLPETMGGGGPGTGLPRTLPVEESAGVPDCATAERETASTTAAVIAFREIFFTLKASQGRRRKDVPGVVARLAISLLLTEENAVGKVRDSPQFARDTGWVIII